MLPHDQPMAIMNLLVQQRQELERYVPGSFRDSSCEVVHRARIGLGASQSASQGHAQGGRVLDGDAHGTLAEEQVVEGIDPQGLDFELRTDRERISELRKPSVRHGVPFAVENLAQLERLGIDRHPEAHEPLRAVAPRAHPDRMRFQKDRRGVPEPSDVAGDKTHALRAVRRQDPPGSGSGVAGSLAKIPSHQPPGSLCMAARNCSCHQSETSAKSSFR